MSLPKKTVKRLLTAFNEIKHFFYSVLRLILLLLYTFFEGILSVLTFLRTCPFLNLPVLVIVGFT